MKKFLIYSFLIILTTISINYFNASFLPEAFKIVRFLGIGILAAFSIYFSFSYKGEFSLPINILTYTMLFSIVMSAFGWDQQIIFGLLITLPIMLWPIYFLLLKMNIHIRRLENVIIVFGFLYAFGYFYQFLNPTNILFDMSLVSNGEIVEDRGIIRVMFPGMSIFILAFCIALTRFTRGDDYKILWLALILLGLVIPVMQVTRSMILTATVIFAYHVFTNTNFKNKVIILTAIATIGALTLPYTYELVEGMIEVQKENMEEGSKYVRVMAAEYFLTEFHPSFITRIFGNGLGHEREGFGQFVRHLKDNRGFYLEDVGMIGAYTSFGIFYILGWLMIFIKIFRTPIDKKYIYVKYYFFSIIPGAIIGQTLFDPFSIISAVFALYIWEKQLLFKKSISKKLAFYKSYYKNESKLTINSN
jgi:hypothetical protein